MGKRDYESAPASETLGLVGVIRGLVGDLEALRAGKISTNDAIARSLLAKQIFNGVRLYLNGAKLLADNARPVADLSPRAATAPIDFGFGMPCGTGGFMVTVVPSACWICFGP